jgi:hypothetical protein
MFDIECNLRTFKNEIARRFLGPTREEEAAGWRKLQSNKTKHTTGYSPGNIINKTAVFHHAISFNLVVVPFQDISSTGSVTPSSPTLPSGYQRVFSLSTSSSTLKRRRKEVLRNVGTYLPH